MACRWPPSARHHHRSRRPVSLRSLPAAAARRGQRPQPPANRGEQRAAWQLAHALGDQRAAARPRTRRADAGDAADDSSVTITPPSGPTSPVRPRRRHRPRASPQVTAMINSEAQDNGRDLVHRDPAGRRDPQGGADGAGRGAGDRRGVPGLDYSRPGRPPTDWDDPQAKQALVSDSGCTPGAPRSTCAPCCGTADPPGRRLGADLTVIAPPRSGTRGRPGRPGPATDPDRATSSPLVLATAPGTGHELHPRRSSDRHYP